jgi:mannose-6-phosphate isomerase
VHLPAAPLLFKPHFEEKIWGGRRLETLLGKTLPPNKPIGESWEISAVADAQTPVAGGPLDGTPLSTLFAEHARDLAGCAAKYSSFPLLIKFIDAYDCLSIQVHPDDTAARTRFGEPFGKTECWYIADAGRNGRIGVGLRHTVSKAQLRESVVSGAIEQLLNIVEVKTGEMYFIPAGTIHAILGDLLVYEVQQSSNTTFRLYDWKRTDSEGNARQLHIEEAVSCADLASRNSYLVEPTPLYSAGYSRTLRITCPYFSIEDFSTATPVPFNLAPAASCRILTVLSGDMQILCRGTTFPVERGRTAMLPAMLGEVTIAPSESGCRFLATEIPA